MNFPKKWIIISIVLIILILLGLTLNVRILIWGLIISVLIFSIIGGELKSLFG
jgi:hypothetical protein